MVNQRKFVDSRPFLEFAQRMKSKTEDPEVADLIGAIKEQPEGVSVKSLASRYGVKDTKVIEIVNPFLSNKVVKLSWKDDAEHLEFTGL